MRNNDDFVGSLVFVVLIVVGIVGLPLIVDSVRASTNQAQGDESPYCQYGSIPESVQLTLVRKNMENVQKWHRESLNGASGRPTLGHLSMWSVEVEYSRSLDAYNEYVHYAVSDRVLQTAKLTRYCPPDPRFYLKL